MKIFLLILLFVCFLAACGPAAPLPPDQGPALSETIRQWQVWEIAPVAPVKRRIKRH